MKNKTMKLAVITAISATMMGCGGGGSSSAVPGQGRFADSAVEGLGYATTPSGRSSVTGANGEYSFTNGDVVTFSVSGITLGSATATTATLLPRNIANTTAKAAQIASLLQNIDIDRNAGNGIDLSAVKDTLSTATISAIEAVFADPNTDFTDANIETLLTITPVGTLISRASATAHVQETLRCEHAGGYVGHITYDYTSDGNTYSATDKYGVLINTDGTAKLVVRDDEKVGNSDFGNVEVIDFSAIDFTQENLITTRTHNTEIVQVKLIDTSKLTVGLITDDDVASRIGGSIDAKYRFTGAFDDVASRIGGSIDAKYRFTGQYSGNDYGLFAFDVASDNTTVSAIGYSVGDDELFTGSGSINGNTLLATFSTGATATASIDLAAGTFSSSQWRNGTNSGTAIGSGCTL